MHRIFSAESISKRLQCCDWWALIISNEEISNEEIDIKKNYN